MTKVGLYIRDVWAFDVQCETFAHAVILKGLLEQVPQPIYAKLPNDPPPWPAPINDFPEKFPGVGSDDE